MTDGGREPNSRGEYRPFSMSVRVRDAAFDAPRRLSMYERTDAGVTEGHEAIHYLQETSTAVGLMSWVGYLGACFDIRARVLKGDGSIELPLDLAGSSGGHWYRWFNQTRGGTVDGEEICRVMLERGAGSVDLAGLGVLPLHAARAFTNAGDEIIVGSRVIQESFVRQIELALVQEHPTPEPVSGGDYELLEAFAQHTADQEGVPLRVASRDLAAFADHALQSFSPAYFAMKYVEQFVRDPSLGIKGTCSAVDEAHDHSPGKLLDYCASSLDRVRQAIDAAFPAEPNLHWILDRLRSGLALRRARPHLIADVLRQPDPWRGLQELVNEQLVPVIIDRDGRLVATSQLDGPQDDLPSNAGRLADALVHAVQVVLSPDASARCPFFESCGHDFKSDDCLTRPWDRAHSRFTCSMGGGFSVLGFKGKSISRGSP